jgi:hypothetical protein
MERSRACGGTRQRLRLGSRKREQREQLLARGVGLRVPPEANHLEQLVHRLAKAAFAREHARELDPRIMIEWIDTERFAELRFAGAVAAHFRERDAALERRDALGDRDVAGHLSKQVRCGICIAGR